MSTSATATAVGAAKLSGYIGAIAIFEYLNIPQDQLCILSVLLVLDFVMGVAKQLRVDKSKLTSHEAGIGALKKIAVVVALFAIALVIKGVGLDGTAYLKGVLGILIASEGYSIIQNIYAVRTGKILPEFDVISLLLKSLGEFMRYQIEKAIKVSTAKQRYETTEEKEEKNN